LNHLLNPTTVKVALCFALKTDRFKKVLTIASRFYVDLLREQS